MIPGVYEPPCKRIVLLVILTWSIAAPVRGDGLHVSPDSSLEFTILQDARSRRDSSHGKTPILLSLANRGTNTFIFRDPHPIEWSSSIQFAVVSSTGEKLQPQVELGIEPISGVFRVLKPNSTNSVRFDLGKRYRLEENGAYRVIAKRRGINLAGTTNVLHPTSNSLWLTNTSYRGQN